MLSRDIQALGEDDARVFTGLPDAADPQVSVGLPDAADPQGRVGLPDAAGPLGRVGLPNAVDPQGRMGLTDATDLQVRVGLPDAAGSHGRVGLPDAADLQVNVGAEPAQPARFPNAANGIVDLQPMTPAVAAALNDLNRRFYTEQASSFSSTRRGSWAGWNRALDLAGFVSAPEVVVDVACGNMRFESYLAGRFPGEPFEYVGIDNCPELAAAQNRLSSAAVLSEGLSPESEVASGSGSPSGDVIASEAPNSEPKACFEATPDDAILGEGSVMLESKALSDVVPGDLIASEAASAAHLKVNSRSSSGDVILSEAALAAESKNLAGEHAESQVSATFLRRDLIELLLNNSLLDLPAGDLVACFGFMHHVPGASSRRRMLAALLSAVKPGGVLIVSFWQFMSASSIAAQAAELTEPALACLGLSLDDVDPGDYILGWQNSPTARRYCHNFTLDEVRSLTSESLQEAGLHREFFVNLFEADGRNNHLNCYLVAKRANRPEGRNPSQYTAGDGFEVSA